MSEPTRPLMTMADLMAFLQVSRRSIERNRALQARKVYVGGSPRWHYADVLLYLEQSRYTPRRAA